MTREQVEAVKACKRCDRLLPFTSFYPRFSSCKDCVRDMNRIWRHANSDKVSKYRRTWKVSHRDQVNELKHNHGIRHREKRKLKQRWVRATKRVAYLAREAVKRALKSKKLIRPLYCEVCDQKRFVVAHHPDYQQQLVVKWLCNPCHQVIHPGISNVLS